MAQEFSEWPSRPSTGRLAERKCLVAVVKPVEPAITAADLGIDMPKARLRLILCSDKVEPEARRRGSDRSFRPFVIDGGKRATAAPAGDPWQALLELFDLGLLVSRLNHLAFMTASVAALQQHGRTDLETKQPDQR